MSLFVLPGDPSLTLPAPEVPVEDIASKEIQSIINQMFYIAKDQQIDKGNGVMVGLAAPQIGIPKQIILVDVSADDERKNLGNLVAYINPKIVWYSKEIILGTEGCYSVDEHVDGKVPRSESVWIRAFDREGNLIEEYFSGFTARIFQHEIDHLNGIRFTDRVGKEGVLHWIPDDQYNEYLEKWENWPITFPWQHWLDMKDGRPYQFSPPHL